MRKKMRITRLTIGTILLGVTIGAAGCKEEERLSSVGKPYVIGVVTKSRDSEYWMSVCSGMEKAASDYNASVLIVSPDTETDDKVQKKMIDDLLEKKVDALAISPINSYDCKDYLKTAKDKGVPVYSYDTEIVDPDVPYIGIDNEKAGIELAKCLSDQLGNQGRIGLISGDLNQTSHQSRITGFQAYIQNNTNIEIAFVESGYSNLQISEQEISRLMEENPGITGIFATSAVTALGIMEYMKERPVKIATVDAQDDAIEAVKNGGIYALASQSGYEIGYEAVSYIMKDIDGSKQDKEKIIEFNILTSENVDQYNVDKLQTSK